MSPAVLELFDLDQNGVFDVDDLNYVARTAAREDPLGAVVSQDPKADVNEDGQVDEMDYQLVLASLLGRLGAGAEELQGMDFAYNFTRALDWSQARLEERRLVPDDSLYAPGMRTWRRLQQPNCGTNSFGVYEKGIGLHPTFPWDSSAFPFDPSVEPTTSDYYHWYEWGAKLAEVSKGLPDAAAAYAHYRSGSGFTLAFDFEKAIADDGGIALSVEHELAAVEAAVIQLHDGSTPVFDFYATSGRVSKFPWTENWQKALGAFYIWSTGTVTYDKTTCRLTADVTIHAQDYYNFNLRGRDIASGSLAADNGRFEVLGWARSFFSQGSVQRTITWDPPCCADTDCPTSNSFTCKCNECLVQCPVTQKSGGQGEFTFAIDVKNTTGRIDVFYNMYRVPDELQMFHEGKFIYLTGGLVSGWEAIAVPFGSSTSTSSIVVAEISAPTIGTAWELSVGCALESSSLP